MNEINDGVTCLECRSVFFSIKRMIEHVRDEHHQWFKSGEGAVIRVRLYTPHRETEEMAYSEGYSDGISRKIEETEEEDEGNQGI